MIFEGPHLFFATFHWQVTHIKTIKQEDELVEIQSDTGTWYRRWMVRFLNLSQQVSSGRVSGMAGFLFLWWEPCWATKPAGGGCSSTMASTKGFQDSNLLKEPPEKPAESLVPLAAFQTRKLQAGPLAFHRSGQIFTSALLPSIAGSR